MNQRLMIALIALIPLLGGAGGCDRFGDAASRSPAAAGEVDTAAMRPLRVVVTVGMLADLVRQVGGDEVTVTQLMGEGVDPHLYKITRDDVRAVIGADMVFVSGLMLEGKMLASLQPLSRRMPLVAVADRLQQLGRLPAASQAGQDPHVWMDLSLWAQTLPIIVDSLAEQRPQAADGFRCRADRLRQQMLDQHRYGIEVMATVPVASRYLVTSHDAFAYFGRAYGLQVTAVQGLSTESEAGLRWINQLVDLIVRQRIGAVFVESSVPRKSMEAVLQGVRAQRHEVVIGGELYSDSAGTAGTYQGTYLGMMDHNLTVIARALGGNAPAGGFRGLLLPEATDAAF